MTSVWIGPPTARSGDHCRIGWFLRVHELNRSTQRHMRMKQRPTSPLTGLKFGFSGKRCMAGSATLASWIDETAVLVAVRRGKGDASPSGGNAVDETADIWTPQVPLWAATSMQATASEMPDSSIGFGKHCNRNRGTRLRVRGLARQPAWKTRQCGATGVLARLQVTIAGH